MHLPLHRQILSWLNWPDGVDGGVLGAAPLAITVAPLSTTGSAIDSIDGWAGQRGRSFDSQGG